MFRTGFTGLSMPFFLPRNTVYYFLQVNCAKNSACTQDFDASSARNQRVLRQASK